MSLEEAFRDLKKCPSTSEVDHKLYIVAIAEPTIFCIRARDGTAYGKVKINKLFKDRIELGLFAGSKAIISLWGAAQCGLGDRFVADPAV